MHKATPRKLLFCLADSKVGGGNRILLELAKRSKSSVCEVAVWFCDGSDITETLTSFDFVFASNACLIPTLMLRGAVENLVLICQGYEPYCYGDTPDVLFARKESLESILKLPIPIIATSKSIVALLRRELDRASYLVPVAIDESQIGTTQSTELTKPNNDLQVGRLPEASNIPEAIIIPEATRLVKTTNIPKRILVVGDYLTKFKGIFDVADALEILAREYPVQLVVLTQQKAGREKFEKYSYQVEFHHQPEQSAISSIYAGCDIYCCGSWYEGFGLPCLEAFAVGIPVVSTRNLGVEEFGCDGENMVLTDVNSPQATASALRRVLVDECLLEKLISSGRRALSLYTWSKTMDCFYRVLDEIISVRVNVEQTSSSAQELEGMLARLESDGYYTPPHVEKVLKNLSTELTDLFDAVQSNAIDDATATIQLSDLRAKLKPYTSNSSAHYFNQFKARFDLCQLLSICETPQDWHKIIKTKSKA